jgi:tRNA pseudouridine55 synthase
VQHLRLHELNGIIVVDKPADMTSAKVVAVVKKLLGVKKVGHTGTLDPFATGVLVCCINKATKLSKFFLAGWKKYSAVLHLGVETDTQDATGSVISPEKEVACPEESIRNVFRRFEGVIEQHPPVYSALKHRGVPLYKLARSGKPVQKPARRVTIVYNRIKEICLPLIRFETYCSAGTYIRTLCADIGNALGCGGHLKELRRTESGDFTIEDAVSLHELEQMVQSMTVPNHIISMADALRRMPQYIADEFLIKKIKHGRIIFNEDIRANSVKIPGGNIKIVDKKGNLIGVFNHKKDSKRFKYIVSCME